MKTPRIFGHCFLSLSISFVALAACSAAESTNAPSCKACVAAKTTDAAKPAAAEEGCKSLFDGKSLNGWKPTNFIGKGKVEVKDGCILLGKGNDLTGVSFVETNSLSRTDYEIELEGKRVGGYDFFCGLTFPVGKACCTLVLGGWGGSVVGISSIDGMDASENETTKSMEFVKDRWYAIRVRVTAEKIECWIDKEQIVDVTITGKRIGMRFGEIEESAPLGIASYNTASAFKNIRLRRLD
ncbi:MAG: DUF1080 domain-containing protein [Verrucomicrobia bacterium]|nr:DUF1080 domain-containing protein [Verrucomicrobiota bacterium]